MAKQKFDGVVEAVRYAPDGSVAWVRAYERRGPTFSDVVLIPRQELVLRLQAGKIFLVGQRKEFNSSDFILSKPLHLIERAGVSILAVNESPANQDHLDGVPLV